MSTVYLQKQYLPPSHKMAPKAFRMSSRIPGFPTSQFLPTLPSAHRVGGKIALGWKPLPGPQVPPGTTIPQPRAPSSTARRQKGLLPGRVPRKPGAWSFCGAGATAERSAADVQVGFRPAERCQLPVGHGVQVHSKQPAGAPWETLLQAATVASR